MMVMEGLRSCLEIFGRMVGVVNKVFGGIGKSYNDCSNKFSCIAISLITLPIRPPIDLASMRFFVDKIAVIIDRAVFRLL